ncbi:MAG: HEAT repeat domain-containing protein [Candidatus Aminicenantes bacterium]|nr:HEAT repeat domain-containing protein [Candidatus Aminicenantes bacterium]
MLKFKSTKSVWDLSPKKKFKAMIRSLKPGKKRQFSLDTAIKYLGETKDKRATKPLIEVLNDPIADYKRLAAEALGKIGDESAIDPLIQALGEEKVQYSSKQAIKMFGESAIKFLIRALNDKNSTVCLHARFLIQDFGEPAVIPLTKALESVSSQVRTESVEALGYIGDKLAADSLYQVMMNDSDRDVKIKAAIALGRMRDDRSVERLIQLSHSPIICDQIKCNIIKVLGDIGDRRAVEPLMQLLELFFNNSHSVEMEVAEALGKIGDESAVSTLIGLLRGIIKSDLEWEKTHPRDVMEWKPGRIGYIETEPGAALIKIGKPALIPLHNFYQKNFSKNPQEFSLNEVIRIIIETINKLKD